jgi:chromosome partitioning protein
MLTAIANHKGGTGKTTTSVNLAAALGERGERVLVVDMDPQAHSTICLGGSVAQGEPALQDFLYNPALPLSRVVRNTAVSGVDLVPATIDLAALEPQLARTNETHALRRRRNELTTYDFTLLDCPPSLGHLTLNALNAAHQLLIVVDCGGHAIRGLASLLQIIQSIADLQISGVLVNEFDRRTTVSNSMFDAVYEYFGEATFQTTIPRRSDIERANNLGQTVLQYAPRSEAAAAYRRLAEEVVARA